MSNFAPFIANLVKFYFQGRYASHYEASLTLRIIPEFTTLDQEEKKRLEEWRNVIRTILNSEVDAQNILSQYRIYTFPEVTLSELRSQSDDLLDVACLSSMAEKSANLKPVRLVAWLADRIRGFNGELQKCSISYLIWAVEVSKVMRTTPGEIKEVWNLSEYPGTNGLSDELHLLEQIAWIAHTNPIDRNWSHKSTRLLNPDQAKALLQYSLKWMDKFPQWVRQGIFDPLIESCTVTHLHEVRQNAFELSLYPSLFPIQSGFYFLGASADTRDRLLQQLKNTNNLDKLLQALAWIGDEVVIKTLIEMDSRYPWKGVLHVQPSRFAEQAGWFISNKSERVNLCQSQSFRLLEVSNQSEADFAVGQLSSMLCPLHKQRLQIILPAYIINEYFSINLDKGNHVLWCEQCFDSWTTTDNDIFPELRHPDSVEDLPTLRKPTYYKVELQEVDALPIWDSRLGGYPLWIQDPAYPRCPNCFQFMYFLAQFDYGDGLIYAFVCRKCYTCAATAQCT